MEHIWVKDLSQIIGSKIQGLYLVKDRVNASTKSGDPYVTLVLRDKTGEVEAKLWDCPKDAHPFLSKGSFVWIRAEVNKYKERPQLRVLELAPPKGEVPKEIFLETSRVPSVQMLEELKSELSVVNSPFLRQLMDKVFEDQDLMKGFCLAPGAKGFHHCYIGGLLEHTLSVVRLSKRVLDHYSFLDHDLLLVSAFLHDIGKVREISFNDYLPDYTDEGRLLGHIVIGVEIVEEKISQIQGFPAELRLRLKHILLSHHGMLEFGSPKRPKTLEAMALNLIDDMDAKLHGVHTFITRDTTEGQWTEYHRLMERFFFKPVSDGDLPEPGTGEEGFL